jgi:TonB family protein
MEKVYTLELGVTAPALLLSNQPPIPEEECKKKMDAVAAFLVFVDAKGLISEEKLMYSSNPKVNEIAHKTIIEDRFKPGSYKGIPVAVAGTINVDLQLCMDKKKDSSGQKIHEMWLRSQPVQRFAPLQLPQIEVDDISDIGNIYDYKIESGFSPPQPINQVDAKFSDEARRARYQGKLFISLIVDTKGMPRNIQIVRPLGMGLDQKAIEAVKAYRFKPAMKDGAPVAVHVHIEISFRLY